MEKKARTSLPSLLAYGLLGGMHLLSGCITAGTTDATAELTKAPFEVTSDLTNGTSRAIGDILEPTKKFLSSTTPGAAAIDRFTRAREKTELFVGYSYEHLRAEVAQGSGEHVASLSVLGGVPAEHQAQFQERLRESYSTLFHESLPLREGRLRLMNAAWDEGWGQLESETIKHQETGIANLDLQHGKPRNSITIMSQR
jgi:hypothetical protein